jgi:dsRNA-specific ribonuclease
VSVPGELTWRQAALVNTDNLARAAASPDAKLQQVLAARNKDLVKLLQRFTAEQRQASCPAAKVALSGVVAAGTVSKTAKKKSKQACAAADGGTPAETRAPKLLADVVESVVAAVLIDSSSSRKKRQGYDWEAGWRVVQRLLPSLR